MRNIQTRRNRTMTSAEEVLFHIRSEWETKIRNMQPGPELDAWVMKYVFKAEKKNSGEEFYWETDDEVECWPHWFSPSTDIAAAWEVVEALRSKYEVRIHVFADLAYVTLYRDYRIAEVVQSRSVPEAICKAALLAVMDGEDEHERD